VITVRTPDTIVDDVAEEEEAPTREQLLATIATMQRDWVMLNAILNATAKYFDWCSEYEGRLDRYNNQFELLRLEGREGRWHGNTRDSWLLPGDLMRRLRVSRDVEML
jgi:hypothetical protein